MLKHRSCLVLCLVILAYLTSACGHDNPYLGTWKERHVNNGKMIFIDQEWLATRSNMEQRGSVAYQKTTKAIW